MNDSRRAASDPLLYQLIETAGRYLARLEDALKEVGLSRAKMEALQQLRRAGEPLPLRALAEGQRCVPSNITTLIDRLEAEGLVRRVDDPADRRSVRAELTPLGAERAEAGVQAIAKVEASFAAALPAAERARLAELLGALRHP